MNPQIQALQQQIDALSKRLDLAHQMLASLGQSSSFPRNVQNAISERLEFLQAEGTGAINSPSSFSSFPVTVPASASGTVLVSIGGTRYGLLYK